MRCWIIWESVAKQAHHNTLDEVQKGLVQIQKYKRLGLYDRWCSFNDVDRTLEYFAAVDDSWVLHYPDIIHAKV